jgi:hypothetical protein|nr:MAG TPA: hypothetical protein [Caudoviricetes sp.]
MKGNFNMSWDFDLCDPVTKKVLETEEKHEIKGGTYCVGGTTEMALNITYNYSDIINRKMEELGILKEDSYSYAYYLNGKTGAETIEPLKKIISSLKDDATEGNAKRALCGLLAFAQLRPDGIWSVC